MASQGRRLYPKASRRERRSTGVTRPRVAPGAGTSTPLQRSYASELTPVDYSEEYRYIRKDLLRILIWAGLITVVIIALWFLPIL